jgi:hypothetical protein
MSPHEQNDDLGRLLNDAVSDIEPRSGIQAIRSRTSAKESAMTTTRNWIFGAFGAAVATAAVNTGVVVAGGNDNSADNGGPSTQLPSGEVSNVPSEDPTDPATSEPPVSAQAVPVYYVGDTPSGPRLYREFHSVQTSDPLSAAVNQAVSTAPDDPDYQMPWTDGVSATASYNGDVITVDLSASDKPGMGVHDPFPGMTDAQAQMAIQQVIFTAQAALGKGRPGVQFLIDGSHTDQILGQPASEPLVNGPVLQTLSLVNLTTPAEGDTVSGTLEVSGVGNSFEANIVVRLQRYEGTYIALQEPITAEGWQGEKLFPFADSFDISNVEPGKYILMAMTDDPSGGAEGNGAFTDTKIITIK